MVETAAATSCPALGVAYDAFDHKCAYEFMAVARRDLPVFFSKEIGYWVVTRREDVTTILRDPETFSAAPALQSVIPLPESLRDYLRSNGFTVEPTLVDRDPPHHTKVRQIAAKFLNQKRFQTMEPQIRQLVRDRIAHFSSSSRVDLVEELTYELPAQVLLLLMGVENIEPYRLKKWGDNRLAVTWGKPTAEQVEASGPDLVDFFNFCREVVEDRRKNPKDDFPSMLLEHRAGDDDIMTINQVVSLVFGVMVAGHETTTNGAGNLILALLSDRSQWERLLSEPELVPNAVEEGLRFNSSVFAWRRQTTKEALIGDTRVPSGAKILVVLGSANHDESFFDDPETFEITRPNARRHIAFGHGPHVCLGAPLARLEIRIVVEELLKAFPGMRLADDQTIDWVRTISFRGPEKLVVELGKH
jgi:cytochrome P450